MAQMNLHTNITVAASSGTSAEVDAFMIPIPHQPTIREGRCNKNDPKSNSPSPLLWVPVSPPIRSNDQRIGAVENLDHIAVTVPEPQMEHTTLTVPEPRMDHTTITVGPEPRMDHTTITVGPEPQMELTASTVPESQICRICASDEEEEDDDVLVELGCSCKGQMSRMHRKCILKWYGVRMLLEKLYNCEICNTVLHINAQLIVARGVTDHVKGGRAILMQALKLSLASYAPHIEVERAANYKELVQLLLDEKAHWFRYRRQMVALVEARAANANSNSQEEEAEPITVPPTCGLRALIMSIGALGFYIYLLVQLSGNHGG